MAPLAHAAHDHLEQQLKDIIQDIYQVMVQTATYNTTDRPSQPTLSSQLRVLSTSLQTLHRSATTGEPLPWVPPELLEYVENGRNPDIYTREFVELVRRRNQIVKGKAAAFTQFRDVLAADVLAAMPELREDVRMVVERTGGRMPSSAGDSGEGSVAPVEAGMNEHAKETVSDGAGTTAGP